MTSKSNLTPDQFEAIVWAMLRIENEIDRMEMHLEISNAGGLPELTKKELENQLKFHKKHFQAFKEMLEGEAK